MGGCDGMGWGMREEEGRGERREVKREKRGRESEGAKHTKIKYPPPIPKPHTHPLPPSSPTPAESSPTHPS